MIAKTKARRSTSQRISKTKQPAPAPLHPLITQALSNGARLDRRNVEIVDLAEDPGGDVIIRGAMVRHKALRIQPAWREMLARGVFRKAMHDGKPVSEKMIGAFLEWYQDTLDRADSVSVKSSLDFSGGGGAAASHIPTHEAALMAQSAIAIVRAGLAPDSCAAFDAVMKDGESFIETARRLCAQRHVRKSVSRTRERVSALFVMTVSELALKHHEWMVPQQARMRGG
jgi:hypothetical protein